MSNLFLFDVGGAAVLNLENPHDEPLSPSSRTSHVPEQIDPLKKALLRIRRTRDFPTISKYIIEINQKLSDHAVQSSATELANIILKDYALTNKLLKLVNSAFYGFVAGKVTTITRAVVLLGFDNVRLAAISLVLFEHFKSKSAAMDLKDAAVSSFWCGLIAKEIARMQFLIDPEEAFICGLLHQLGKLLTIYHMPDAYREIKYQMINQSIKESKAVKQVLGIPYTALGIAIARQWNFPERIVTTMVSLSAEELEDNRNRIDPLCALSNFINALCRIIDEVRLDRREHAIESLLDRYGRYVTISTRQLKAILADGLCNLYRHADALQFSLGESKFLMRLAGRDANISNENSALADEVTGRPHSGCGSVFRLADEEEISASAKALDSTDAVSIIMSGIQEISNTMMGDYDINDIALMSIEIIYRALQCNRSILFINESRNKTMEARFGYGESIQPIVDKVRFDMGPVEENDLFSRSIQSGKDLIVEDSHSPELHAMIPSWYRLYIDARAFVFMPIVYRKVCVGAYYADMDFAGPPVSALDHKYLSMLRNQLVLAIKMGR